MWKNVVDSDRPPMKIWDMRFAYWITKITHTQYIVLFVFPWQQWLSERTQILLYNYIA